MVPRRSWPWPHGLVAALLLGPPAALPGAAAAPLGALVLDNLTFDKVLSLPGTSLLAMFDQAYSQADPGAAFAELCTLASPVKSLLIGEVGVKDFGDNDNADLAARYKLSTDDFPAYLLFGGGAAEPPVKFEGLPDPRSVRPHDWDDEEDGEWEPPFLKEPTADTLAVWLRKNGVKVPALGTIVELDEIVRSYFKEGFKDSLLAEARKIAEEQYPSDRKAPVYLKIMQKAKESGVGYVQKELARVKGIVDKGAISTKKAEELGEKVKILQALAEA